ncbi:hypothetical protein BDN70DRAFT_919166 [Pholiota conissans]|uniref:Uncharacterized protein n=1 Tax=Pholiota conissans TaxID=109636 RepID=A0A9P5Z9D3_9AGAR|nr:hypothetical protein BDN70DRAFT_919166 [Pholiota conissans]
MNMSGQSNELAERIWLLVSIPRILKVLYFLWFPDFVRGAFQILVQTPAGGVNFKPGDPINFTIVSETVPNTGLGVVLTTVQKGSADAFRNYTIWSVDMAFSPEQFSNFIPATLEIESLYTLEIHQTTDLSSTLLAIIATPFQIDIPSDSTTTVPQPAGTTTVTEISTFATTSPSTPTNNTAPSGSHISIGPIIGGALGGAVIVLISLALFIWRRRQIIKRETSRFDALAFPESTLFTENIDEHPSGRNLHEITAYDPTEQVQQIFPAPSSTASAGYSLNSSNQDQIRSKSTLRMERERMLGEIRGLNLNGLPMAGRSMLMEGEGVDRVGDAPQIRARLEELTQQVRSLESALADASLRNSAPPEYDLLQ